MTEFEYDCLQKKLVALSAQHRVGRRRQVTLPSDRLNEAELARRNGPCRIYRLGRPMKLAEFEAMPPDLQRDYLRRARCPPVRCLRLRQRGADDASVSRMQGIGRQRVQALRTRHRVDFDRPDPAAWKDFLGEENG